MSKKSNKSTNRHPVHDAFSDWVRTEAVRQKMAHAEIARRTEIDKCAFSSLRNRWNPSITVMSKIAGVLGFDIQITFVPKK